MTHPEFIVAAYAQAQASGHIWPAFAACEAAEESAYGTSRLAVEANNLFGLKSGRFTTGLPTIEMHTHEWEHGEMVATVAVWPKFETWAQAFDYRMRVLRGLAPFYPNYSAALSAKTGEDYVIAVSKTWSTDPRRASNVLSIYRVYTDCFTEPTPAAQ
ncbi:MAG: glucosaminidase domain-containing protein [Terriglobales bacterium]